VDEDPTVLPDGAVEKSADPAPGVPEQGEVHSPVQSAGRFAAEPCKPAAGRSAERSCAGWAQPEPAVRKAAP